MEPTTKPKPSLCTLVLCIERSVWPKMEWWVTIAPLHPVFSSVCVIRVVYVHPCVCPSECLHTSWQWIAECETDCVRKTLQDSWKKYLVHGHGTKDPDQASCGDGWNGVELMKRILPADLSRSAFAALPTWSTLSSTRPLLLPLGQRSKPPNVASWTPLRFETIN